ncbi:MAG: TonB-dependent receptor plug domain-containing protein, partial [candidate division Zixibacteria bacterium]|nr:TonB-dependent receptor plug domain-containing protein [candidate division Zixibacteria bacterium]
MKTAICTSAWVGIVILCLATVATPTLGGQSARVRGVICSQEARQPLPNVYVKTPEGKILAISDYGGTYTFRCSGNCPSTIRFSLIGYADTLLRPQYNQETKSFEIDTVFLVVQPRMVDGLIVTSDRLQDQTASAPSSQKFDLQQISAASGSLNDPLRFLQQSPSVTSGNDIRNDLVIRGGNPAEAVIMVEGFETANINHFGSQGSTGGPFGMIAANQVSEIRLATGAYSVRYPNRLSGLAEIDLVGMDEVASGGKVSLDLSGAIADLRLGSKTSPLYLLAHGRKSYLDLLKSPMNMPSVPQYVDANIKAGWRISPSQTISLFTLNGADRFAMPPGVYGFDDGNLDYRGDQVFYGIKWSSLLSPTSLLETRYAFNYARYDIRGYFNDHAAYYVNQALERTHRFSCDLSSRRSSYLEVNIGGSLKYTHADYPLSFARFRDEFG